MGAIWIHASLNSIGHGACSEAAVYYNLTFLEQESVHINSISNPHKPSSPGFKDLHGRLLSSQLSSMTRLLIAFLQATGKLFGSAQQTIRILWSETNSSDHKFAEARTSIAAVPPPAGAGQ